MPFITARVLSIVQNDATQALADAGENQSVLCEATITLDGQILLDDIVNHTFEWEQTFGTPVTLINPNTLTPSFVNPQLSDIEFTLYVDRNTPFEDSDAVFISRRPQDSAITSYGITVRPTVTQIGAGPVQIQTQAFFDADATVMPLAFTEPLATYSPIYTADDVDRIRQWPSANYQLMNNIDLSSYNKWIPIGSTGTPFVGEIQGNGFVIDNLTIDETPAEVQGDDPFFSNVVLLADFDGADGATTYTEKSNSALSATFNNSAVLDTGQSVFGTSSLQLDNATDDFVSFPANSGWNLGGSTGKDNFTIEFRIRWVTDPFGDTIGIMGHFLNSPGELGWEVALVNNDLRFVWSPDGTLDAWPLDNPFNPAPNTWYAIAIVRNGDDMLMFVDGTQIGVTQSMDFVSSNDSGIYNPNRILTVGSLEHTGVPLEVDGWMDEVRITKGIARYLSDYTPATQTFQTGILRDAGLFGRINNGATIQNLGLTNVNITNQNPSIYSAGLVGSAQGPTTDDGGAVTIIDCWVTGNIASGGDRAGGLIGHTGTNISSVFTNTYSDVTITDGGQNAGGWAGNFQTEGTYIENYSNTTKTTDIVGTAGDVPGATEVSGLTTAQLNAEANYTNWDFTNTWEIIEGVSPATLQNDSSLPARALDSTCDQSMIRYDAEENKPSGIAGFYVPGQHIGFIYKFVGVRTERLEGTGWIHDAFTPAVQRYIPIKDGTALRGYWRWQKTMNGRVLETIETLHPKSFGSKFGNLSAPGGSSIANTSLATSQISNSYNLVITISNPRKIAKTETQISSTSYGSTNRNQVLLGTIARFVGIAKEPTIPAGENVVTSGALGNSFRTEITGLTVNRSNGTGIGGG